MTALSTLLGGNRAFGRGYIDGLILANGTDADHDINIAAGEARDSTNTFNLINTATLVKQIDAAWAAGSAAGGLFSGSVANATWYHVFLIRKDSDGTIDAGFDTSVTAANKPSGYSTYRRIGSVLTNGSANILAFKQNGDNFSQINTAMNGTPASTDLTALTLSTPLGVSVLARCMLQHYCTTSLTIVSLYENSSIGPFVCRVSTHDTVGAWWFAGPECLVRTDTSSQILFQSSRTDATILISVNGWIDPRGKDA